MGLPAAWLDDGSEGKRVPRKGSTSCRSERLSVCVKVRKETGDSGLERARLAKKETVRSILNV